VGKATLAAGGYILALNKKKGRRQLHHEKATRGGVGYGGIGEKTSKRKKKGAAPSSPGRGRQKTNICGPSWTTTQKKAKKPIGPLEATVPRADTLPIIRGSKPKPGEM